MKLNVVCVAYQRPRELRVLADSFILQTNPNWNLTIVYDGKCPQDVREIADLFTADSRITFIETAERTGFYGHINRGKMLKELPLSYDYVLMTNDDNYYTPKFVEYMLSVTGHNVGVVYCDTVHSHFHYALHRSQMIEDGVDMGAFIVRADVAKEIGFNRTCFNADSIYAEECAGYCRRNNLDIIYIPKPLFVHN